MYKPVRGVVIAAVFGAALLAGSAGASAEPALQPVAEDSGSAFSPETGSSNAPGSSTMSSNITKSLICLVIGDTPLGGMICATSNQG